MPLADELQALARSYLERRTALEEIRHWLVEHAQAVVDAGDPRLDDLDGELWLLISELDKGDRDEANIREELELFFRESHGPTLNPGSSELQPTASGGDTSAT